MEYSFLLLAYLIGSIPTGKILVWQLKKIDIQTVGSQNIGATNVGRILGKNWAIIVFLVDFLKGFIPTLVAYYYYSDYEFALLVGLVAILGHNFSLFLKFKGGKGVAITAGVFFTAIPILVLISAIFQLLVLKKYRKMSIATFAGVSCLVFLAFLFAPVEIFYYLVMASIFIIFRHKDNMYRLIKGDENQI